MSLIAVVKSKFLSVLCIALVTTVGLQYWSGKADRDELNDIRPKLLQHIELNKTLSQQNLELAEEVRTKPVEYITITKDVVKQVCDAKITQEKINALPSKRKEGVDEKVTADIDDRLPTDLIKLLK